MKKHVEVREKMIIHDLQCTRELIIRTMKSLPSFKKKM